jgi:hypothetical protein
MKILDRMVGEWQNEQTVTNAATPNQPKRETFRVKAEAILGGRFVEEIVTNDTTGESSYSLVWFDPGTKLYRRWFFSSAGPVTELAGTWDEAAKAMTLTATDNAVTVQEVFQGDGQSDFHISFKNQNGKTVMETKGVARRVKSSAIAPFTDAHVQRIAALPAAEQVEEVRQELMRRNPGYDGLANFTLQEGTVRGIYVVTNKVTDISPIRVFHSPHVLDLSGFHSNRQGVGQLADLTPLEGMNLSGLTYLHLAYTKISDAGMGRFKDCKELGSLALTDTGVGDAGLKHFKVCKKLWSLGLEGTKVTDTGLANFKDCKNLTNLQLAFTQVGDAGLLHFKDCGNLIHVSLSETRVTDAGLANFKGKPLKTLLIDNTGITDLTPLQGMPLEDVRLTPKNITKGLDILRDMKSLKTIGIEWDKAWPAAEFWERHDKGEFK